MIEFLQALSSHAFLQHALVAGLLVSAGCGVMGSYVVVKRIGVIAGGIAHAVLGGMGVAYFLGAAPLLGAMIAALVAAVLIGLIRLRLAEQEDVAISALWAIGMAVGILFISRTPGYNVDLMSYLFGNILLVRTTDLWLMLVLDLIVLSTVFVCSRQFLAVAFDEEFARLRGVNTEFHYLLLLCLVALTVVLLIQVVGLILVIALLTLPAAAASQYARTLRGVMGLAVLFGAVCTTGGIALSYGPDLPTGATIILVAGAIYVFSLVHVRWLRRLRALRSAEHN